MCKDFSEQQFVSNINPILCYIYESLINTKTAWYTDFVRISFISEIVMVYIMLNVAG